MVGMMDQMTPRSSDLGSRRRAISNWAITSSKLRYRDWVGDAVLTVVAGVAFVVSVFLPWANQDVVGDINYAFSKPAAINGAMSTEFGLPVMVSGIAVILIGVCMIVFGPNRFSIPLGFASCLAAGVVLLSLHSAARSIMLFYDGGLGLSMAFVTALVLPVIGLASAMVGAILSAQERRARVLETSAGA